MLTTAEELGLSGVALSSRVQRALYGLPESQLAGIIDDPELHMCGFRRVYSR